MSPEPTATRDPFSVAQEPSAGPAEEEWDPPLVTSLKVGGGIFFSGKEEGYSMTLHAKNGKPGCISFRFMIIFILRGGTPPLEPPWSLKLHMDQGVRHS